MKTLVVGLCLALMVVVTGCAAANPCDGAKVGGTFSPLEQGSGYLRTSIETWPENEKRCFIEYLDQAQEVADRGEQELQSGDIESLYSLLADFYRQQADITVFRQSIEGIEAVYGRITAVEYRNQALEYPAGETRVDFARAQSRTWYAITTEKSSDKGLFLTITVIREDSCFGILAIKWMSYGDSVPSWLQAPNARPEDSSAGWRVFPPGLLALQRVPIASRPSSADCPLLALLQNLPASASRRSCPSLQWESLARRISPGFWKIPGLHFGCSL